MSQDVLNVTTNLPLGNSIKSYAPRVFVSSTTRDLGSYRQVVCDELWKGECFPVVQERFPSDPRKLSEFLEDAIRKCDTVICLLGPRFGEAPDSNGGSMRSYTQMEYDVARQLNKDVYVFLASPSCVLDDNAPETDEKCRLQQAHIESVQRRDQSICKMFSRVEDLRACIIRLVPDLSKSKQLKHCVQGPAPYPYFAGREAELQQLTQATIGNGPSIVVLLGVAGQGKTTLAWEWFSNHCPEVFAAAFWCPAEENEFTFDMFVDLSLTYLLQGKYDKRSFPGIQTRVRILVQHLRDRPCLLVVDGLEKWLMAWTKKGDLQSSVAESDGRLGGQEGLDYFLSQLCSVSGGSHVVLTSRVLPSALDSAPHAVIPVLDEVTQARLQGLDDSAAVVLLRKIGVRSSDEEILAIANKFEKHPLSLTILGKLASRKYGGSLERYKVDNRLIAEDQKLRVLLEEMQQALPGKEDSTHLLDLLAHFIETPSYKLFSDFLRWLVINPAHTALVVRPAMHLDDDVLREAMATLDDWSLIAWDRRSDSVYLHPLLREYFRGASTRSKQIHEALGAWYLTHVIAEDAHSLQDMRSRILALEHGLKAQKAGLCDNAILMPVAQCASLSEWMALWGHQSAGIDLLTKTIGVTAEPERSKHLISRGAMYQDLGKLTLARNDLSDAIKWFNSCIWNRLKYREVLAGVYMNRGNALASSGQPKSAIADSSMALRALTYPLGLRSYRGIMTADILTNQGTVNRDLGHLSAAENDATNALSIYIEYQSHNKGSTPYLCQRIATAFMNRGNVRANGRQYDAADEDYCKALSELSRSGAEEDGCMVSLLALIREMRGLLFNDKREWMQALKEHDVAVKTLSELVRNGRLDFRTTLGLAYSNRAETQIALGNLQQATDDVDAAKRIYDQATWEDSSRLAIWVTANQTTLRGLERILKKEISIGKTNSTLFQSWKDLSFNQGAHVLAPFVRANTGIAQLVFKYDPQFSADAVLGVLAIIEDGIKDGYWSEWLVWEMHDLHELVTAHQDQLASLGVPIEKVGFVYRELKRKANQKGKGVNVPV
jgi:tetratricopeptide (TPR) repeat protein